MIRQSLPSQTDLQIGFNVPVVLVDISTVFIVDTVAPLDVPGLLFSTLIFSTMVLDVSCLTSELLRFGVFSV